jgi:hypothetical protein
MNQVETNKGLIDRDQLTTEDLVHETSDARVIQTVWKDVNTNEEVRRDVTISILRGLDLEKTQGA